MQNGFVWPANLACLNLLPKTSYKLDIKHKLITLIGLLGES